LKPSGVTSSDGLSFIRRLWLATTLPLQIKRSLIRSGIWKRLVYSFLSLKWFEELACYWVEELGGRPIYPKDFVFLSGLYRKAFSELGVDDAATSDEFLSSWQDSRLLYSLFFSCHKEALNPIVAFPFVRFLRPRPRICEYGCAIGPITKSLCTYYRHLAFQVTGADLPHLMLHFYRWRFRDLPFVRSLEIDPGDPTPLDEEFDAIFCMTVFEHLPRPLETANHLLSRLNSGGILVFDYVASQGSGLDTGAGRDQRLAVLKAIDSQCEVLMGKIHFDGRGVGTVVARKS
jgi:2-polyprenyl-3-methyl-5-hydroxy-6-metoxy-1,4-benzoquinol methylase